MRGNLRLGRFNIIREKDGNALISLAEATVFKVAA
jgi:hypothetical protein